MKDDQKSIAGCLMKFTRTALEAILRASVVFLLLMFASSAGWAQGLPTKSCPVPGGGTVLAYLCLDDIVVVDGSGYNGSGFKVGGLYLVNPTNGNQTPISTGGTLGQAASVTIEPGTGKLLASTRTFGVIRVDPKDGSQEVLLKGGTGWGTGFPTFFDSANNVTESFIYPGGITIDPVDSSILVTDTGINLFSTTLNPPGNPNCTNPNDVRTCESFPGKIIRIKKGQGAGVYAGTAVVAKGGLLSDPFDLVVDSGSSLYVTDMNAKLGGASDPGLGGIIYLNASNGYAQSPFFSSYSTNTSATTGCPMGITINGAGTIFATVFTYNGYGCAPQAVFSLKPDPFGANPPILDTVVNGYPLQFPFGMDPDRNNGIIIADEGSGYSCGGTIFRFDLTRPYQPDPHQPDPNPFALSPYFGLGCTPPNQTYLSTPADVAVVKIAVSANIATPPSNVTVTMNPATIDENGTATLSGSFTDPDASDSHTVTITWGDGSADTTLTVGAGVTSIPATAHQYRNNLPSNAPYTVNVSVIDSGTTAASGSTTVTVNNVAPVITGVSGPSGSVKIGDPVTIVASFTDVGTLDTHTCSIAWGDGQQSVGSVTETNGSGSCTAAHPYTGSGTFTVGVVVTDNNGASGSNSSFQVRVNTAPVISGITGPTAPLIAGSDATINASFTDVDTLDTHTCAITWDDSQTSAGSVTETNGSGSCTKTHTYSDPGVYSVGVTITDNLGTATKNFEFVVIFDPTEGSVNGSGSINSPVGAYAYDTSLHGTATFGFSANYARGALVPNGYKQFSFSLGNLYLNSSTIDWLVISGPNAQFHGRGDVNGDGRHWTFLVTVKDGQQAGGGGIDKYRVKLTDDTGLIVYDNVRGASDDIDIANPQQIASGNIVIFLNSTPAVSSLSVNPTTPIDEGGTVTLTGTFTDSDAGQSHTVTINWGDGGAGTTVSVAATTSNFTATHKYKDDNPTATPSDINTISVTVSDTFGAIGTGSVGITVNNVAPVITSVTGPTSTVALNGAGATVRATFTDVGTLDTHICTFNWGDGQTSTGSTTETNGSGYCTASHPYSASGPFDVQITVTDDDTGSASSTQHLVVNTPPAVTALNVSKTTINEGDAAITLTGTFTDADTSTHTVTINWGDGTVATTVSVAAGSSNFSTTHQYKDDNPTATASDTNTITVTVSDPLGGMSTPATANITVNNVAPVIGAITKPGSLLANTPATVKANFTDKGTDVHTCTFDFGDGPPTPGTVTETTGTSGSCTANHTYTTNGPYSLSVTVTDDDTGTVTSTFQINAAPILSTLVLSKTAINENEVVTFSGTFTDADAANTHKITIDWGDGGAVTTLNRAAGVLDFSTTHRYLDDNPTSTPSDIYTINVTISDNVGGSATGTTTITVNNVAPVITVPANAVYGRSPGLTQTAWSTFSDVGTQDTHTCIYDWGDGSNPETFPGSGGVCSISHTYASSGTYTFKVTVKDDDSGDSGTKTYPLIVP